MKKSRTANAAHRKSDLHVHKYLFTYCAFSVVNRSKVHCIIDWFRFLCDSLRFFVLFCFVFECLCTVRTHSRFFSRSVGLSQRNGNKNELLGTMYASPVLEAEQNRPFCLTCKKSSWITNLKSNYTVGKQYFVLKLEGHWFQWKIEGEMNDCFIFALFIFNNIALS